MKPKLYLETTIPSYLTSRPSRDLIVAGHQQITRDWWDRRRNSFDIHVSQLVVDEVKAGDPKAALERLNSIRGFTILDITPEIEVLATGLVEQSALPSQAESDAAHIAIAAVHGMSFLVTWNCAHLANAAIAKKVAEVCRQYGFECPVICTPYALLGE